MKKESRLTGWPHKLYVRSFLETCRLQANGLSFSDCVACGDCKGIGGTCETCRGRGAINLTEFKKLGDL